MQRVTRIDIMRNMQLATRARHTHDLTRDDVLGRPIARTVHVGHCALNDTRGNCVRCTQHATRNSALS
jgi:hypothetical protein